MKQNEKQFKILNSEFRIREHGFSLVIVMVAFLVLFTTISLVRVGTLDQIHPDLKRIGINLGSKPDQNLAVNSQPTPQPVANSGGTQIVDTPQTGSLDTASSSLGIDESSSEDANEGDNPKYIE